MKINRIAIENITSLKGMHCLDFEKILGSEDIFAITGPTGSGKSSILSAIGIALYNCANKEGIAPIELVSQGAEYGKIDLHFSVGAKNYRSTWECRLKQRNGTLLKAPRLTHHFYLDEQLIELDGEKILGLSYQQFCKTVILNQGQFAEFLTSKYTERKSILETLFDSDRLTVLGNTLNEQIKSVRFEMQSAEQSITAIMPSEEISLEALQSECLLVKNKSDDVKTQAKLIQSFKERLEDYAKLRLSLHEYQERKNKLEVEIAQAITTRNRQTEEAAQANNELISYQQKFEELRPKLLKTVELQKTKKSAIERQDELQLRCEKNRSLANGKKMARDKTSQEVQLAHAKLGEFQRENPTTLTINQLQALETNIKKIKRSHDISATLSESKKLQSLDQKRLEGQLSEKELKRDQLHNDFLTISSVSFSQESYQKLIAELEISAQEGEVKSSKRLLDQNKKKELENQLALSHSKEQELANSLLSLEKQSNEISLNISNAELRSKNLEQQIELNRLENAIQLCTIQSEHKSTCVVCHTPWKEMPLFQTRENKQFDFSSIEAELKSSHQNLIILAGTSSSIQQQLENIKKQQADIKTKIQNEQEQLKTLCARLSTESLETEEKALAKIKMQLSKIPSIAASLQNISHDVAELKKQIAERRAHIKKIDLLAASESEEQHKHLSEVATIAHFSLATPEEAISFFEGQQKVYHRRLELTQSLESLNVLLKQMNNELERISEEGLLITSQIKAGTEEIDALNRQLLGEYNFQQPAKMLEEMIERANRHQLRYNQANEKLITTNKEVETKYSFINSIDDILKTKELEKISYEAQHCDCPDQLTELFAAIKAYIYKRQDLYQQDNDQAAASIKMFLESSIIPLALELHQQHDELRQDFHRLNGQYKAHLKNEERIKSLRGKYDHFKTEYQRLALLNDLIGKQEFRDFALSIIERELIKCANIELKRICDARYQLKQQQSGKHKFEFFVIDHFAGAQERKVNTLSGGETFLVSLAMAMALSEMTRGKIEIDSFFIDEGFGSLDEESLNDALETLLQIRNRGKRIGIISHVQGLNERIPVNIKISKNELGESSLSFTQQSP